MEDATVPQMRHLVILAPNWLGDAVMALPAMADVRRRAPRATITVAARPAVAPLFGMVRDVDATIVLAPRHGVSGWLDAGADLRGDRFDAALLLPNSFQSAFTASRAGIAERWGYRTDWRRALLTKSVAAPRGVHQIEYYQHLVRALGFPSGPPEPTIDVTASARDSGHGALMRAGWDGRTAIVAIAPGAAYGGAKRWPPAHFAELVRALRADGVVCVMVGSAADRRTGDEIEAACGGCGLLNLIGATDLTTLAGVLVQCRSLVSNDSGAMHFGAAAGVPVTAVFGPTNDRATGPLGGAHVVLTHPVWCRPCMLRECPIDHRCMRGISSKAVHEAARRNL
ncbi:MAG TPA: lipopolysaccharide heptosyltransferase II [Vicinamibacterales bacterium]|nr:lipopolysaccharide heptosyltransferase II [Vicinamibacterales bacterium]